MLTRKTSVFLAWLSTLFMIPVVNAGDVASLLFVGFASDGSAYYIQSGRQDGSGYPYAVLARSSSLGGEEIERLVVEDSAASVMNARDRLYKDLGPDKTYQAGKLLFARVHTDVSSSETEFFFHLSEYYSLKDSPVRLVIEAGDIKAGEECYGFFEMERALSFSLSSEGGKIFTQINDIKPSGCIRNYRAGRVFTAEVEGKQILAIFFMVNKLGFEGDDVRWAAFTVPLDG